MDDGATAIRTAVFLSDRSQAVRLPQGVAFEEGVREVVILREAVRRVTAPADAAWDDYFALPGVDPGERRQPIRSEREAL